MAPDTINTNQSNQPKSPRDSWGHKSEFLLASIGLAVGLGNIWRFPYLAQKNGGGAFLVPYIIFMIIEGIPIFIIEYSIGQRFRTSSVQAWSKISPALRGVGWSCIVVSFFLCIYYIVVLAWCVYYFFMSFNSTLPWDIQESCINNPQYQYILSKINEFRLNVTAKAYWEEARNRFPDCCVRDPAQWYFYQRALRISSNIEDVGVGLNGNLVGCLIIGWVVTYLCVVKGIKSSGKVVYFTAVFPYIVLIIFFFRGITLDGAKNGIEIFFKPKWEKLVEPRIWLDAATQMFFTLSLGFGALISFASYMPVKNNCVRDAYTVVLINCGTSLFAGIVVFSILGHRELKTGLAADKVSSGPGLAFMAFSDAMLLMEGSPFWSVMFFLMLILLGIDSEFGTLEAAITPFYDTGIIKSMRKEIFTALVAAVMCLIGLCLVAGNGFYIFQIFDDFSVTLPLLFIAFFQCIGVTWIYGSENFANDIEYMTGYRPNFFWLFCWKYVSPIALVVVFVTNIYDLSKNVAQYSIYVGCEQERFSSQYPGDKNWLRKVNYPVWGQVLITIIISASLIPIVAFLLYDMFSRPEEYVKGFKKRFSSWVELLPDPSWVDKSRRKTEEEMKVDFDRTIAELVSERKSK